MSMLVRLLLFAVVAGMPALASALEPERSGQESFLTRAVFAEGRLWILSDAGVRLAVELTADAIHFQVDHLYSPGIVGFAECGFSDPDKTLCELPVEINEFC